MDPVPEFHVPEIRPRVPIPWDRVEPCCDLVLSGDGGTPRRGTRVRIVHDDDRLHVRFDCDDPDPWSTFARRDEPLWKNEAVEVFLAPGAAAPTRYLEFQVSPKGVLYDARVHNPDGRRETLEVDPSWDCPGVHREAGERSRRGVPGWWAVLAVPLEAVAEAVGAEDVPRVWRANFYRVERPRDGGVDEFSAWSPTCADPPDFHVPGRFGVLRLNRSAD